MQLGVAHYVFFERLLKDDRFVSGLEAVIISAGDIVAAKFYCLGEGRAEPCRSRVSQSQFSKGRARIPV